jgi:glycosyltransferase involved in cell wall biosynthesis
MQLPRLSGGRIQRLVWLGPAFTISEALAAAALAPAASRWQQGFLTALSEAGVDVRIVASHTERMWPRGPLSTSLQSGEFFGLPRVVVPFLNVPLIRERSLKQQYEKALDAACSGSNPPDVIATYNAYPSVADACRIISQRHSIPWVPFLLDHERPDPDWKNVLQAVTGSSGVVLLSHWGFVNAPIPIKLHLDAGVSQVPGIQETGISSRVVLYAGSLHKWGGIDLLLDSLAFVQTPTVKVVIVGRGASPSLLRRFAATPTVQYLGGVSEDRLAELTREAEILVNPRPSGVSGNEMNFPSKLVHYLESLKPVVTTLTPGVSPEYEDLVIAAADDSPKGFAAALDRGLSLSPSERLKMSQRIRAFLETSRLWSIQVRRFLDWASDLRDPLRCVASQSTDERSSVAAKVAPSRVQE